MTDNLNKEKQTTTHKIGIYLWIWALLFVLSFFSYMVDWLQFQGLLKNKQIQGKRPNCYINFIM